MASKRGLLSKVEKLLDGLLSEAQKSSPAVVDEDGIEVTPARQGATFGERLKLAEVVTMFETRRQKIEEDTEPSGIDELMRSYQGNASGTIEGGSGRKGRKAETNGIANAGHVLPAFRVPGTAAGNDSDSAG